jgi:hypothetical protein
MLNIAIIFISSSNIISMECNQKELLSNNNALTEEIKKHQHYFSPEKKQQLIGQFLTGKGLFDAGFLQAHVASGIDSTITPIEQSTYLLHKTFKYLLQTCTMVNTLSYEARNSTIIALNKLYGQLQWFAKDKNITQYTPHVMFNISFQCAFLNDMAHERTFVHYNDQKKIDQIAIKKYLEDMPNGSNNKIMKIYAKDMHNEWTSLLQFFKEIKIASAEISEIQLYFDKCDETVLLPIINKKGMIGINTFNRFLSLGYGLSGFGKEVSPVHAKGFPSITNVSFHDLLHIFVWVNNNKNASNLEGDLFYRKIFLEKINILSGKLIGAYQKASVKEKEKIGQYLSFIFFTLHEKAYSYAFHSPQKDKLSLIDEVRRFFDLEKIKNLNHVITMSRTELHPYLFTSIDQYFLLRNFTPEIDDLIKEKNLKIRNFSLCKTDNSNCTAQDLKNFTTMLAYFTHKIGQDFLKDYKEKLENTFPYE